MKAIMISIKPKWCAKIMNEEKTIEVRKSKALASAIQKHIDEYGYVDIYVYCTKDKEQLTRGYSSDIKGTKYFIYNDNEAIDYRGKVVFKFRCYKVEEIKFNDKNIQEKSCLSEDELFDYLFDNTPYQEDMRNGYAIHISDLEIFKPKELSEFYPYCKDIKCEYRKNHCSICHREPLTKAPQNYCYIEGEL